MATNTCEFFYAVLELAFRLRDGQTGACFLDVAPTMQWVRKGLVESFRLSLDTIDQQFDVADPAVLHQVELCQTLGDLPFTELMQQALLAVLHPGFPPKHWSFYPELQTLACNLGMDPMQRFPSDHVAVFVTGLLHVYATTYTALTPQ